MRLAIQKNLREFIAVIVMIVLAMFVGGYILSNQRFYLPAWVPVLGTDFFELKAEFATAQSVTPGQGQTVQIAGVSVGEIKKVNLEDGRAVVTLAVRRKHADMIKQRRDHAPAAEDRPQGHGHRDGPGHADAARGRGGLHDPGRADASPTSTSTRSWPASTATRATTCACWSRAAARA